MSICLCIFSQISLVRKRELVVLSEALPGSVYCLILYSTPPIFHLYCTPFHRFSTHCNPLRRFSTYIVLLSTDFPLILYSSPPIFHLYCTPLHGFSTHIVLISTDFPGPSLLHESKWLVLLESVNQYLIALLLGVTVCLLKLISNLASCHSYNVNILHNTEK